MTEPTENNTAKSWGEDDGNRVSTLVGLALLSGGGDTTQSIKADSNAVASSTR